MNYEDLDITDPKVLRIMAEEQLKVQQNKIDKPAVEANVERLMHELQVHQIELEMQNEELRRANETAEAALKKYTMLYDLAPMGYFTLDSDGSICELNFTGAEMLGSRRISLVNHNFKLFIAEESKTDFDSFFTKLHTGEAKQSCEVMLSYDNKLLCYVYLEGVVTGDERNCLLSAVDISGFRKLKNT